MPGRKGPSKLGFTGWEKLLPGTKTRQGTILELAEKVLRAVGRGFYPRYKQCNINAGFSP
jgi:hypothetical protein